MAKQKTNSGAKKRFKVTGTGKIMFKGTKMRHNLEKKSSRKERDLKQEHVLAGDNKKGVKKLLNI